MGTQTVWRLFCFTFLSTSGEEPAASPRAAESIADNDMGCVVSAASVLLIRAVSARLPRRAGVGKGGKSVSGDRESDPAGGDRRPCWEVGGGGQCYLDARLSPVL